VTYKVIQWSTGNVGRHALRLIAEHPDLELAGLWVHSTAKAGVDAGELAGIGRLGIRATNDADALLALDADCVCYTATADLRPTDAIADMARIAASGKNIVSSSVVPLVFPEHVDPQMRRPLEEACASAGVSCFTSGIDPGWANDLLPLVRAADRAVRHDGLRTAARREAVAADPGRVVVRVGRHREGARGRSRRRD
jgi:4-hydroxy-tetrahydrodipicolinate reductase